eukprot:6813926-Karenia_brevis.AAC.1
MVDGLYQKHQQSGESASNGVIKEAGKTVRECVRVMKDQNEKNSKMTVEGHDVITMWMIRWAAMMISRFSVGRDGRTAYDRRRGRQCHISAVPFGELVWYKESRSQKERDNKFNS